MVSLSLMMSNQISQWNTEGSARLGRASASHWLRYVWSSWCCTGEMKDFRLQAQANSPTAQLAPLLFTSCPVTSTSLSSMSAYKTLNCESDGMLCDWLRTMNDWEQWVMSAVGCFKIQMNQVLGNHWANSLFIYPKPQQRVGCSSSLRHNCKCLFNLLCLTMKAKNVTWENKQLSLCSVDSPALCIWAEDNMSPECKDKYFPQNCHSFCSSSKSLNINCYVSYLCSDRKSNESTHSSELYSSPSLPKNSSPRFECLTGKYLRRKMSW